jgi:beta-lactamase superfamily II metal-dependent hydrolase
MEFHVFNVGHGFCALLVADNGNTALFDCGHDDEGFKPSEYLKSQGITHVNRFHLSHFDSDHVSDLHNLRREISIGLITRNPSMSAAEITTQKLAEGVLRPGMVSALEMHRDWIEPVLIPPIFPGVEIVTFHNSHPSFTDSNNLSLVTFLHYGTLGIIIPGDLESAGWEALLENDTFCKHLARTNIFISSHHGRENGYCEDVFKHCSPALVIISDTVKQFESQEHNYHTHARGVKFANGTRTVLTTRSDGHISFYADANGTSVKTSSTPPALGKIRAMSASAGR